MNKNLTARVRDINTPIKTVCSRFRGRYIMGRLRTLSIRGCVTAACQGQLESPKGTSQANVAGVVFW